MSHKHRCRRRWATPTRLFFLFVILNSIACVNHAGLLDHYDYLRPKLAAGSKNDWAEVAASFESQKDKLFRQRDRVMYWLNLGTALHYAGDYAGSSVVLVQAEEAMQELWTKSISEAVSQGTISETLKTYSGEDYERTLSYLYTALNAAMTGKVGDALVETRRADAFLQKMRVHYEKEGGLGTNYKQDAFMLWLIGLFYELEGSYSDAHLAYKASLKAYKEVYAPKFSTSAPHYLAEDVARASHLAGRPELRSQTYQHLKKNWAELIVIHGIGEAPHKEQLSWTVPVNKQIVRVAVPKMVSTPPTTAKSTLSVDGQRVSSVLAEPIAQISLKNFKDRLPAIQARAAARAVIKFAATEAVSKASEEAGGGLFGAIVKLGMSIGGAVAEAADLRSWALLPSEFQVSRIWVPAGPHQVEIRYLTASGGDVKAPEQMTIELRPRERKIISVRSL